MANIIDVSAFTTDGSYKAGDEITITINFGEAINVDTTNGRPALALSSGGEALYIGGSGASTLTFEYVVQPGENSADLDYANTAALSLNGATMTATIGGADVILTLPTPGTAGSLGANRDLVIDPDPILTISSDLAALKIGDTATITFAFSEDPGASFTWNGAAGDVVVSGGALSAISGSGLTRTATFTPTDSVNNGAASITVTASSYADATGNLGGGATRNLTFDTAAPTVAITSSKTVLRAGETTTVTIAFSEAVSGFGFEDLTVQNGVLPIVTSSDGGMTWTGTLTPTANLVDTTNVITFDMTGVRDLAGQAGVGTTSSANYAIYTAPVPEPEPEPGVVTVVTPGGNRVTGDAQDNVIMPSGGADTVSGGGGDDAVQGGERGDVLQGNVGDDSISGGGGADLVYGGQNDDVLHGNTGDDRLYGDKGHDMVLGGQGFDFVQGGQGDDYVSGDLGDDVVLGGQGNDQVFGGAGGDYLSGDLGSDTVTGGTGADIFHSSGAAGLDLVTDFNRAEGDRVLLDPGTSYVVSQVGGDVHIVMTGGGELVLAGVQLSSLASGWITA